MAKFYQIYNKIPLLIPKYSTWSVKDSLSKTTKRVFKPNFDNYNHKQKVKSRSNNSKYETVQVKHGLRLNSINMQMLSKTLYNQIFKGYSLPEYRPDILGDCLKVFQKHGVKKQNLSYNENIDLIIPPLEGETLEEHFKIISKKQAHPYMMQLEMLLNNELPSKPNTWLMQKGWTMYEPGKTPKRVDFPEESALIFDVEVCVSLGKAPTIATAVGTKAWYGWVSEQLLSGISNPIPTYRYSSNILIPLESSPDCCGVNLSQYLLEPKIVVCHNASYDRSRVKEQYWLERTGLRFLDTMAMHVSISGLTSYQRAILKSGKASIIDENWMENSSLNSLKEIYKLYCQRELNKDGRTMFLSSNIQEIFDNFQILMNYCSCDVNATYEVFCELYPIFLVRFPHPATFAGMLELSTAYLPINSNWDRYINDSEQTFQDLNDESTYLLSRRADQACHLLTNDRFKHDLWMWDQDWTIKDLRQLNLQRKDVKLATKPLNEATSIVTKNSIMFEDSDIISELNYKFRHLHEMQSYSRPVILPGYPNWYRKLCIKGNKLSWTPGVNNISTSMQITPKLLSLKWEGFPLHYIRGLGWGFLIPMNNDTDSNQIPNQELIKKCPPLQIKQPSTDDEFTVYSLYVAAEENLFRKYRRPHTTPLSENILGKCNANGIWCDTILADCVIFMRLPHKNGSSHRVGNPLAKDFLNKFSQNVLTGDTKSAEYIIDIARQLSYWRNNRDRIRDQMVVILAPKDLPDYLRNENSIYGAIIPQVVVSGTLTRRAVEPTWMTASNANEQRIGSELRAMVQAPPGFSIVGADVDSQELWIASVIGDAGSAKMHGATPLGWMTLSGSKANGSDMHSVTANAVGISRDHAKVINYARIYGAGQKFAARLLKQFNPTISSAEANKKAMMMFQMTKGKRMYRLKDEFLDSLPDKNYSTWQAYDIAKIQNRKLEEVLTNGQWMGGSESAMFNKLEEIANNAEPITPFLGCRLSRALEQHVNNGAMDRFLPTRINWVVQSGAVDFLHLLLVCIQWIMQGRSRFCLSFHDEVRYIVRDEHKYKAALAMHIANLLTRSFCSLRLGIADLPQSVAFFDSVEVDTLLRKDAKSDCKTPSNPHGLLHGYGIANGENLDIYAAILRGEGLKSDWFI